MKVAVCGSGNSMDDSIAKKTFDIGKEIAKNNLLLLTGSCLGYPHEAAKGAFSNGGKVIGVSPAKNLENHKEIYNFPDENFTQLSFTGLGIPARNFPLVSEADAVIIVGGQTGTLNEFTIALAQNKPIGILEGSGGITKMIKEIAEVCNKNGEKENIVYSKEPKELVNKLMEVVNSK
ncbi:LOG family protein [Candidatus Woesearchaeota archaeon]|nr:LOG family protein [Candidatus Woesearchaeota archaeon]